MRKIEDYPWIREERDDRPIQAVSYNRVSSKKQVLDGNGTESQEIRNRQYALGRQYPYVGSFEDKAVSGGERNREGFNKLLRFLEKQPSNKGTIVLIDDISRLARDLTWYREFKEEILSRGASLETPALPTSGSPSSKYFELSLALRAEFERDNNRDQVLNRQRARLLNGYWPFRGLPLGYKFVSVKGQGKLVVPNKRLAPIARKALLGFASGQLLTQSDVKLFLEKHLGRRVSLTQVRRLLDRADFYAGFIEYPKWSVDRLQARHRALITEEDAKRVRKRLSNKGDRKTYVTGYNAAFPLKGVVVCDQCKRGLRGYFANGRNSKKYPVYECKTKDCPARSVARDDVHKDFIGLLSGATPAKPLLKLAEKILRDVHAKQTASANEYIKSLRKEEADLKDEIALTTEKYVASKSKQLSKALDERVAELEDRRQSIKEERRTVKLERDFEPLLKQFLVFIENPTDIWNKEDPQSRKLLLQFMFLTPPRYTKGSGFRNTDYSLPYKVLSANKTDKSRYVEMAGVEPASNEDV